MHVLCINSTQKPCKGRPANPRFRAALGRPRFLLKNTLTRRRSDPGQQHQDPALRSLHSPLLGVDGRREESPPEHRPGASPSGGREVDVAQESGAVQQAID